MNIDKYRVHDLVKFNYSEIGEYIGEGYTDKPLRNDEIVDLLNKYEEDKERIKELKKENKELHFILKQLEFAKNEGYDF